MEESLFLNPAEALRAAGVGEGMHVADFGASSGFFTRAAARLIAGLHSDDLGGVWALDSNPDLLARIKSLAAAEGLHNVEILRANVESPQGSHLPAGQFDFAIVANLLFSVENKDALAREVARVLHPGGRALIIDWRDSFGGMGPHPDHVVSADAARTLMERNGFSPGHDIPAGEYHWGFVVRKKSE